MIEKKTVSLYLNNVLDVIRKEEFTKSPEYASATYIRSDKVFDCISNIISIIQKEPSPTAESKIPGVEDKKNEFESETKKIIEIMDYRISKLEYLNFKQSEDDKDE